jgi:nucleoside phosphorylase
VNLFTARLRAASAVSEERPRRIEQALEAWRTAEPQLSSEGREQVLASATYNVLDALDVLERDDDLDRQIEALSLPLRLNRNIEALIARVLRRREEAEHTSKERREAVLGLPSPSFVSDEVRGHRASPLIDLLVFTALTEEGQVVEAVMAEVATRRDAIGDLTLYDVRWKDGRTAVVATACAHHLGAVNFAVFAAPLLKNIRPRSATLVGIAAAVDTKDVALGDVPFASEVLGYDDIAVENSTFSFRTSGYQVDPRMLRAAGALRISLATYQPWQDDCMRHIQRVVDVVNALRRMPIQKPPVIAPPHFHTGIVAGGPFLLRDRGFRDALRRRPQEQALAEKAAVSVAGPVHPKLVSAEMESKGFMAAANEAGVPATVIKGISDDGDERKAELEQQTGGFYRVFACSNAVLAAFHVLGQVRE